MTLNPIATRYASVLLRRWLLAAALLLSWSLAQTVAEPADVLAANDLRSQGRHEAMLEHFMHIGVIADSNLDLSTSVSPAMWAEMFETALGINLSEAIMPEDDEPLSENIMSLVAAMHAIDAVDQGELVLTFHALDEFADQVSATAQLLGFLPESYPENLDMATALPMLLQARIDLGLFTPYLGHVSDPMIFQRVRDFHASIRAEPFQEAVPALFDIGSSGLLEVPGGTFTGYNIKDYNQRPLFARDLTVRYDHGNLGHLLQMISLLRREGFDAHIDVKTRISSYVHLINAWGPPNPSAATTPIDDERVIVHGASFDILIEFADIDALERFMPMVDSYARRREEDTSGLIRAPYYAPVYASVLPLPGYEEVIGLQIVDGHHYLQSYILPEFAEDTIAALQTLNPDKQHRVGSYFVNPEFVRYLEDALQD